MLRKKITGRIIGAIMALSMISSALPVYAQNNAATKEAYYEALAEEALAAKELKLFTADDGAKSDEKTPRQVNVHMGDNPSSQVNFTYTTASEATTQVVLNKQGNNEKITVTGLSSLGSSNKSFHQIAVSGLEANTVYEYTVGYGENTYDGKFKTAPAPGSKDSFKFVYLADTQVSNATNAKALGATLSKVNDRDDISFVYIAGDVTDTAANETQWEYLFNNGGLYPNGGQDMFGNNLLAVIQGNHDNNTMNRHINAPAQEGNIVYSFDYGPATFIMLNLETARSDASARENQKQFMIQKVNEAKARGQWTVVGFHKSLYSGASHITDSDIVEARKYWAPLFAQLDVDMVLQGHDHVYSRGFITEDGFNAHPETDENGVVVNPENAPLYMIGGHAGGLKWYSKKNYTVGSGDPLSTGYEFLDVNSTDDGSDVKQEQVIVELEISEDAFTVNCYMFKYDTSADAITTPEYLYDTVTVKRDSAEETQLPKLHIDTDAHLVSQGDYFRVDTYFDEAVESNAAILEYTYDTDKFEYRAFTPGNGVTVIDRENTDNGFKMTVMVEDYNTKDYGEILFSAKKDADLQNEDNVIAVAVEYVIRDEQKDKSAYVAKASTTFTSGGGSVPGDIDGDGKVTILDLSDIIDIFGADTTHENWNKYKFFDYNGNGIIDIYDVAYVAKRIER